MKDKNCMTATYSYDDLVKAYDNFMTPVLEIYMDNKKDNILDKGKITVDNIQITLSAMEASGLSFQVVNVFDPVSTSIKSDIKDTFSVGKVIEVALGYGSNLTKVFKGYVTEFRVSYQSSPVVSVTAVDLRKLLMQNKRLQYLHSESSYGAIFEKILGNYKSLYNQLNVDKEEGSTQGTEQKNKELLQNTSDYYFIKKELCQKADRDFFVVGGDVYFKEPEEENAFIELKWGKSLISFQRASLYCNEQVKVYSTQDDKTVNSVDAEIKTEDTTPSLTRNQIIEEVEVDGGMPKADMNTYVDKIKKDKKKKNKRGSGTLVGLPEIVPGRYIKISGVDSADAGIYYISEVTHSYGSDGFDTTFTIGNKQDSLIQGKADPVSSPVMEEESGCMGITRAVVKENWNEQEPGKVLVEFLSGEKGKNDTKWLPVLSPYCGKGYGVYFHPEIDTEVLVGTLSDSTNSMVVLGGLWNKKDTLPSETAGEQNEIKKIRTKGEHEILFRDTEDAGSIEIKTAKGLHIVLDDKEEVINLLDKDGENGLKVNQKEGTVQLLAKKKISISVNGKDGLVFDNTGKLALKADQIAEDATTSYQLKTQKLELKGSVAELKADGSVKINSSGMAEIKGSLLKLN